jgi:hypothetical protein
MDQSSRMSITKKGTRILSIEDWLRLAGPKYKVKQWVDGRSAKELAKYWVEKSGVTIPAQVADVLLSSPDFGSILNWNAEPEVKLRFDKLQGEPRNTDMLIVAEDRSGPFLIGVEGKADESFAQYLKGTMRAAHKELLSNPRSNRVSRIEWLTNWLLPKGGFNHQLAGSIRYQLLTATAGLLAEAHRRQISRAVLLVQEFVSDKTTDRKHTLNSSDLNAFTKVLSKGVINELSPGKLSGPIALPPSEGSGQINFYLTKISHNTRSI